MNFYSERHIVRTRGISRCDVCFTKIELGTPAVVCAGKHSGDFWTGRYHAECRVAEVEFNELLDFRNGDEWTQLNDIENDMIPWLKEEHPVVFQRMFKDPQP